MNNYHEELYLQYEAEKRAYFRAVVARDETFEDLRDSRTEWRENLVKIMEECAERRKARLEELKKELKKSAEPFDKVYYYAIVEKQKATYTARMTGYSERQIRRIYGKIKRKIRESLGE